MTVVLEASGLGKRYGRVQVAGPIDELLAGKDSAFDLWTMLRDLGTRSAPLTTITEGSTR